jgi:hypothetical protein
MSFGQSYSLRSGLIGQDITAIYGQNEKVRLQPELAAQASPSKSGRSGSFLPRHPLG